MTLSQMNGQTTEDTLDWFAQDEAGNVWYFGEGWFLESRREQRQAGYRDGSSSGSWRCLSAEILARDRRGFRIRAQSGREGYGSARKFDHCLKTKETSGLEPDTLEFKFYAPDTGLVFIDDVLGRLKEPLVKIINE